MDARRSARNAPCAKEAQEGVKGGTLAGGSPFAGGPRRPQPLRFTDARSHPTPGGGGTLPLRVDWRNVVRLAVNNGKGRRGRRPLRVAARPGLVPWNLPGAGRGVGNGENAATGGVLVSFSGRRGRRPLQGGCDAMGPAVIQRPGGGGTPPLRGGRRQARVGAERPPPISAGAFLFVRFSYFFGKLTLISVPCSLDSRLMRPLWYWAACFTMDRPRPVPPVALEWLLSTR